MTANESIDFSDRSRLANIFLSKLFFVIILSFGASWLSYYLLTQLAYYPGSNVGGAEVFLLPRYMPGQNGLNSGVFRNLHALLVNGSIAFILLVINYFYVYRKVRSFRVVLFLSSASAFIMAMNFLGFSANGFQHLKLQIESINNGSWFVTNYLTQNPEFSGVGLMGKMRYIFSTLGGNDAGYTVPGTTHPPGVFLIILALRAFVGLFKTPSVVWGVLVAAMNCILVVAVGALTKICFSEKLARKTCLLMLTVPSVCFHFCSMIDGVPSVFIALGYAVCALLLRNAQPSEMVSGLWVGAFFTLSAQFSYGHIFPISAALLSLYSLYWNQSGTRRLLKFSMGLLIAPIIYFIFEYWVSNGTTFYPLRAIRIASAVKNGLDYRPYPLSQVANFVVMSIMGGILFLPALWTAFYTTRGLRKEKQFIFRALIIVVVLLAFQKTVRLEVERTWHWAFILPWAMMGVSCLAVERAFRKLFSNVNYRKTSVVLYLSMIQLLISICLAISIQDYY